MLGLLKSKSKVNLNERMSGMLEAGIEKQVSKIDKELIYYFTSDFLKNGPDILL